MGAGGPGGACGTGSAGLVVRGSCVVCDPFVALFTTARAKTNATKVPAAAVPNQATLRGTFSRTTSAAWIA